MELSQEILALIIIGVVLVVNVVISVLRRNRQTALRPIEAYDELPYLAGESVESGEPIHIALGSAAPGTESTLLALVGSSFVYYLTREVAVGTAPVVTTSEAVTIPLLLTSSYNAYREEELRGRFNPFRVRWYPQGARSLAYAAALMTMQEDDRLSANVLVGRYGTELALILDAAYRTGKPSVAVSDQLDGQAIAYALADQALIGEEVFAVAGYMESDNPAEVNRNIIIDRLRLLFIVAIIALMVAPNALQIVNGG